MKSNLDILKKLTDDLNKKDEELKLSQNKYFQMFDSVAHPMLLIDYKTTTILEANLESIEVYGYTKEELLSMTKLDLVDDVENVLNVFKNKNGYRIGYDKIKNGSLIPVETYYSYCTFNDVEYVICSVIDISDKVAIVKDLKLQNELYKGLVCATEELIVRIDAFNNFKFINNAYANKFGINIDDYIGKSFTPLVHPEDYENTILKLQEAKQPPYRVKYHQRAMTPDGWKTIEWEVSSLFDDDGDFLEYQAMGRDVTECVQTIKDLNEKTQNYKALIKMFPFSLIVTDLKGKILEASNTVGKISGKSLNEIIGTDAFELMAGNDKNRLRDSVEKLIVENTNQTVEGEYEFYSPEGPQKGNIKIALVESIEGYPIALIGSVIFKGEN